MTPIPVRLILPKIEAVVLAKFQGKRLKGKICPPPDL
jgi:hypothetical protein